ncbi:peptidyl-prolyl cis-trans isomerase, FKBP-type [Ancylostoma ceylanicum]|uniref:peptidylprolyl isomerase n=1 Tax=Ancylostoma ceylanicum TaxID=53326 RepID=A0A0D6M8J0_9BILA|nr:peptidyl-prolyl cis-trans isomerase, FKBP-type [Ancylostoma ceylanicum]
MFIVVSLLVATSLVFAEEQKLSWKDDDGLEVKIIKPIKKEKCTIVSQEGDVVEQFYKLSDKDGKEIGSNFGKKPYTFTLGKGQVIAGMDRAMTGMCIGEKRKVVIPGHLGFGSSGRERDSIEKDQTLYYTVQLVDLFRAVPGDKWETEEGITIEQVIKGMDIAMTGMCEGERRKVIIPSDFGYGDEGRPPQIPGKARLYFDITLEKLIKKDEL